LAKVGKIRQIKIFCNFFLFIAQVQQQLNENFETSAHKRHRVVLEISLRAKDVYLWDCGNLTIDF